MTPAITAAAAYLSKGGWNAAEWPWLRVYFSGSNPWAMQALRIRYGGNVASIRVVPCGPEFIKIAFGNLIGHFTVQSCQ